MFMALSMFVCISVVLVLTMFMALSMYVCISVVLVLIIMTTFSYSYSMPGFSDF